MKHFLLNTLGVCSLGFFSIAAAAGVEYVALGDSIAFGFDPTVPVPIPFNYTGYPEIVAQRTPLYNNLVSLACPGETSGSFLSSTAPDAECRSFRAAVGLKSPYVGTQGDAAIALLSNERDVRLVTISIGANDLILLQRGCQNEPTCILRGLPAALKEYAKNLTRIFTRLRLEARYRGRIALLTYFSPDYRDPIQSGGIGALNIVSLQIATLFGANVADGFGSFALASAPFGGDTCAAGMLVRLSPTTCDVHPSLQGRNLLADAVLRVVPGP